MAALHTPRELELIIRHELSREREVPKELFVQIFRVGDRWRAGCRFRRSQQYKQHQEQIAQRVSEIGTRVAKDHRLIG